MGGDGPISFLPTSLERNRIYDMLPIAIYIRVASSGGTKPLDAPCHVCAKQWTRSVMDGLEHVMWSGVRMLPIELNSHSLTKHRHV